MLVWGEKRHSIVTNTFKSKYTLDKLKLVCKRIVIITMMMKGLRVLFSTNTMAKGLVTIPKDNLMG